MNERILNLSIPNSEGVGVDELMILTTMARRRKMNMEIYWVIVAVTNLTELDLITTASSTYQLTSKGKELVNSLRDEGMI